MCSNCLPCKCAWCFFPWPLPLTQAMGMAYPTNVNNVGWPSVLPWLALLLAMALLLAVVLCLHERHLCEHLGERSW